MWYFVMTNSIYDMLMKSGETESYIIQMRVTLVFFINNCLLLKTMYHGQNEIPTVGKMPVEKKAQQ